MPLSAAPSLWAHLNPLLEDVKNTTRQLIKYALFNRWIYLTHKSQWDKFQDVQKMHPVPFFASLTGTGLVVTLSKR